MYDVEKDLPTKMKTLCQHVIDAQDPKSLMIAIRELNDYLETVKGRKILPLDETLTARKGLPLDDL